MRTRSTIDPPVYIGGAGATIVYDGNRKPPVYHHQPWTGVYSPRKVVIVDEQKRRWLVNEPGDVSYQLMAYKPVDHTSVFGTFPGAVISYHYTGNNDDATVSNFDTRTYFPGLLEMQDGRRDLSHWAEINTNLAFTKASVSTDVFYKHFDRWDKCKPSMTTRANLAVFIAELRDVKRMFELLPRKHFKLSDWKEVFRYGNGLHLNYNFGWKPFIRDVLNSIEAYRSFEKRFNRFLKNDLKPTTFRKRDDAQSYAVEWTESALNGWYWKYSGNVVITRTSAFQAIYEVPKLPFDTLRWRAWCDSFGLHITPKNIWAIVPWSFVVDWFANVSNFLSAYDSDWLEPWIKLIQACSSFEADVILRCELFSPTYFAGYTYNPVSGNVWQIHKHWYKRSIGAPNFKWDTDSLNADRIRLLASLVASRVV